MLTAVSEGFKLQHQVDVGDLLLSINLTPTTELSNEAVQVALSQGATVFQVARKTPEQLSIDKNGFSAKGCSLCILLSFLLTVY